MAMARAATEETKVKDLASKFSDATMLDMVFVMDATGSMGSYIHAAQQTIRDIVQEIVATEKADVRFALISYRDHPPQDSTYVTNVFEFSNSVQTMRRNLDTLSAQGGGDSPEAVVDGLHAALKLDYRDAATKVCILIADAPPHGLAPSGDGFPNGCPCGLDPMEVCKQMAEKAIALYCIGCEPSLTPYKSFFMAMAHSTGGQYCPLGNAATLSSAVVSGMREEIAMERVMRDVDGLRTECAHMDEDGQARYMQSEMKKRNIRVNQMKCSAPAVQLTDDAVAMSKAPTLASARAMFVPSAPVYSAAPAMPHVAMAPGGALKRNMMPASAMSPMPMSMHAAAMPMAAPAFGGGGAAASAPPPASASYHVEEDEASLEWCHRLVNKSNARKK